METTMKQRAERYYALNQGGIIEGKPMRGAPLLCKLGLHKYRTAFVAPAWTYQKCERCRRRIALLVEGEESNGVNWDWITHRADR